MTTIDDRTDIEAIDPDDPQTWDEPEREAWRITNDGVADWSMRKLARAQQERQRIVDRFEEAMRDLTQRRDHALRRPERDIEFFGHHLSEYHAALYEAGKAGTTYPLAYGNLTSRQQPARVEIIDADAFTEWAEGTNRLDLLRVKVEPDKTALKRLPHKDGSIVDEEGEVVPGVVVVEGERTFTPKPASDEQPAWLPRPEDNDE